jgi:NADPH:quinone reductase-like Zn-dependent oxidoreductase
LTAYQYLFKFAKAPLSKGQSIFINGGSGGVGLFTVQMARVIVGETGKVVTCCSTRNLQLVKSVGADEVIDYTAVNLPEYLSQKYNTARFDMVVDTFGSFDLYNASPNFLKDSGDFMVVAFETPSDRRGYISIIGNLLAALFLPAWLGGVPRRFTMSVMAVAPKDLQDIAGMISRKEIKPVLDSVWSFDDEGIKGAYQKLMTGHATGKVVIKVPE